MFEAKLEKAALLKKILEAIKELVEMANFECTTSGMQLQAMDSSHVSLVALLLHRDGFSAYRCDRSLQLGIKLPSMAKILKCAGNDDSAVLRCEDGGDTISFSFNTPSTFFFFLFFFSDANFVARFQFFGVILFVRTAQRMTVASTST